MLLIKKIKNRKNINFQNEMISFKHKNTINYLAEIKKVRNLNENYLLFNFHTILKQRSA